MFELFRPQFLCGRERNIADPSQIVQSRPLWPVSCLLFFKLDFNLIQFASAGIDFEKKLNTLSSGG